MERRGSLEQRGSLAVIRPEAGERVLIFGDIHGDLEALKRGISLKRPGDYLIFLGDYADRGAEGVEVIEGIDTLMQRHPDRVVALMGNHEEYSETGEPVFSPCTLIEEAERKRGGWREFFESRFRPFASRLFLSAVIPGHCLFLHGGIENGIEGDTSLADPDSSLRRNILWSDPSPERGSFPSMRGAGRLFGPDITESVLRRLDVDVLFRSHEPRKAMAGPAFDHEGRVVTLSSTGVYGGRPFLVLLEEEDFEMGMSRELVEGAVRFLDG